MRRDATTIATVVRSLDTTRGGAQAALAIAIWVVLSKVDPMLKRAVVIFVALWVGLVLPSEAFAYRIQSPATESASRSHAMHAAHHDGHCVDARHVKPAHCPHCGTAGKCPKACVSVCATTAAMLSLAVDAHPLFYIAVVQLPSTFAPSDISPPHTSRLLRPPIA